MQSILDYGRGHQTPLAPARTSIPEEDESQFNSRAYSLVAFQEFAQLDKLAQQIRADKSRIKGGVWKLSIFTTAVARPGGEVATDAQWQAHLTRVKKWVEASPQSAAARIALANTYISYASFARGAGYSNTVSDQARKLFGERVEQGKRILLEAAQLQEKCPSWYEVMQTVATDEGWDKKDARTLFDQAAAFEPAYYHYYRQYGNYLLPKWYGDEGETQALAEEAAAKLPEPDASITYYEIASLIACQCDSERDSLAGMSWPRIRQGYGNLVRLYGTSELKSNRFAYMSYVAGDKSSAKRAFASIQNGPSSAVWRSGYTFVAAQAWANQP
jgi:hypothetical protein